MSLLPRSLSRCAASSSRSISSSAGVLAAAKGKTIAKPARKNSAFSKKPAAGGGAPKRAGGGASGGSGGGSGVVLRYSQAAEVPDMGEFRVLYPDEIRDTNIGTPTSFARSTFEQLKVFGLPRRLDTELENGGGPTSVIRKSTVELARLLSSAKGKSTQDARYVISGDAGSGKSMLLLQTVATALDSEWIVIYVPRADEWIKSSSAYAYDEPSKSFHQPALAAGLLQKLLDVNAEKLAKIALEEKVVLGDISISQGQPLDELCRAGLRSHSVAALTSVLEILAKQTEYPVLLAIDEVQALFTQSEIKTPTMGKVQAYNLSTPQIALDYVTGRKAMSNGVVFAAVSYSTPSLPVPLHLSAGLSLPTSTPLTPYTRHEPVHLANASSGIKTISVPWAMGPEEAAGIWKTWAKKGWAKGSDETFLGAYNTAAGNPREFTRALRLNLQAI